MDENKLRSALRVIASDPEPPTTVDVAAARRRGHRRQQARRVVVPVAVALAVAAAVIVPVTQFRGAPDPSPAVPTQAPSTFNALVPYAAFGWLPAGFSESRVPASNFAYALTSQTRLLIRTAYAPDSRSVRLYVNPRGACRVAAAPNGLVGGDTCGNGRGQAGQVPPVNGRPARPLRDGIAWEYAPDAWAVLTTVPLQGPGGKKLPALTPAQLHQIASHVLFGQRRPIFFPFRLTGGLPTGWQVSEVEFRVSGNRLIARDGFLAGPAASPMALDLDIGESVLGDCMPMPGHPSPVNRYGVQWFVRVGDTGIGPGRQTICPVDLSRGAPTKGVVGRLDGLQVWISLKLPSPLGDAYAVYHRLTLLGRDPAGWTDRPLG